MLGVCLDANNPAGRPAPQPLAPFTWLRQVAFDDFPIASYYLRLQELGFRVAMVLANESFGGEPPSPERVRSLCTLYQPQAWIVGNEMDAGYLPEPSPSSWKMGPTEYASFYSMCAREIRASQPEVPLIMGGLVSGQPSVGADYQNALAALGHYPTVVDIHPYGKDAAGAESLLRGYHDALGGTSLCVLEWHQPPEDIWDFQAMLDVQTVASCWFCWSDGMVDGFGLVTADGTPKAAYGALLFADAPDLGVMTQRTLQRHFDLWLNDPAPHPGGVQSEGQLNHALTGGLWDPSNGLDPTCSPFHVERHEDGRQWGKVECARALVECNDRYEFWIVSDARALPQQMAALRAAGARF